MYIRKYRRLCVLYYLLSLGFCSANAAPDYVPGRLLVKFDKSLLPIFIEVEEGIIKTDVTWLDYISETYEMSRMEQVFKHAFAEELGDWYQLDFPVQDIEELLGLFEEESDVFDVELDYELVPDSPDDSLLSRLWYHNTIQTNSSYVWNDGAGEIGDTSVLIAVVDFGVHFLHEDFGALGSGAIFTNPGEGEPTLDWYWTGTSLEEDSVDNDGNGFIDDYMGWDFRQREGIGEVGDPDYYPADTADNNPFPVTFWPDTSGPILNSRDHGTAVAGVAASVTNNETGISGIAGGWGVSRGCQILPLRGESAGEWGRAIEYAVGIASDYNRRLIINMSFGVTIFSPGFDFLQSYIGVADSLGALLIASAGNGARNYHGSRFPSDWPEVMSVAATNFDNERWFVGEGLGGTNFGEAIDIAAPGDSIMLMWMDTLVNPPDVPEDLNMYGISTGTSFAAPMVAGVAGLVWSANPSLTNYQLRERILSAARDLSATEPDYADSLGAGLLNAPDAIAGTINLFGEKTIDTNFVIGAGRVMKVWPDAVVTVEAGVELTFGEGAQILVQGGGSILFEGTNGEPITLRGINGSTWKGLKVQGGVLEMNYVNMQDFEDYGIFTDAPTSVTIDHCRLDGGDLASQAPALLLWNSPSVTQTVRYTTIENIPSGVGFYPYNSYVNLEYDTIRGCNNINSYIKKVSGHIHGCWFEGRTSTYAVYFNSSTCNPNLTCCTFKNLAPRTGSLQTTLYSASSCSPTFAGDYGTEAYPAKSNVITDTSAYLLTFYGTGLKPTIHINDWYQNSANGKFMQWQSYPTPAVAFDVDRQYWNHAPSTAWFTPANAAYWDWTPNQNSAWLLCADDEPGGGTITMPGDLAGGGNSLDSDPTEQEWLTDAMTLEASEDFESARDAFQSLALAATVSDVRWRAMVGCVTTDVRCAASAGWVEGYLDSLETLEGGGYQAHLDHTRILYNHYLNQERYDEAIEECTSLLSSGLLPSDSIFVAVDLLGIQMAAGLVEYHGGLDGTVSPNIPQSLQVTSLSQGVAKEFELLSTLDSASLDNELVHQSVLPTEFKLFQNYPNPFNPVGRQKKWDTFSVKLMEGFGS